MAYSSHDFADEADVSRETFEAFQTWQALLVKWNARINLVSKAAIDEFWPRHALDSWQVWEHVPHTAEKIIDFGSGGGFPGLALAIGAKSKERGNVTLVESAGKKANFLRTVIRALELPATVWEGRAEDIEPEIYDVISARAFAPLPRLFGHAEKHWGPGTLGLLLKGQGVNEELTEAEKSWIYDVEILPSRSDALGVLLKVQGLSAIG